MSGRRHKITPRVAKIPWQRLGANELLPLQAEFPQTDTLKATVCINTGQLLHFPLNVASELINSVIHISMQLTEANVTYTYQTLYLI